jgi:NAD(P)H dehydrogenase (quinone)
LKTLSIDAWQEVEILELYSTELQQNYLRYEEQRELGKDKVTKLIQEKITWADELVFIFPIWWWDMPAIMKNFWDTNFTAWFSHKYLKWWKSEWLLKWKTARVIATSWAPFFLYKVILHIQFFWKLNRISFVGMKLKSFTIFWDMNRSNTDRDKYLEKIYKLV